MLWFAACDGAVDVDPVLFMFPSQLSAPAGGTATATGQVGNQDAELDLIVAALDFDPAEAPLLWTGDGPWTIEPGGVREFTLTFRPREERFWTVNATLVTDAGERNAAITLEALPPVDLDRDGFFAGLDDCDDTRADVNPGQAETCDDIDNNCDDDVDEGFDRDFDGYRSLATCPELGDDCNDNDKDVFPGNLETCSGTDSDCNGIIDDIQELADKQKGVCAGAKKRCTAGGPVEPVYELLENYEPNERSCDGLDNDCDGSTDRFDRLNDGTPDCIDDDGDGFSEVEGDCDDRDRLIRPENCTIGELIVTRNDDGFAIIDLKTGAVDLVNFGFPTYHGVALDARTLWFAARDERRLARYNLADGTAYATIRFESLPWAVEADGGDLLTLFGDGRVQRRDANFASLLGELPLGPVKPTAWTRDEDGTLWTCTSDGWLFHHDADRVIDKIETGADCYGPPAVRGSLIAVPGLLDQTLTGLATSPLEILLTRTGRKAAVRPIWAKEELWVASAVDRTVEIHDGGLLFKDFVDLGAQTQGVWYDEARDWVWVAVYGNDEVVAIERLSRKIVTRIPVPAPVYLFPTLPASSE
jgi:hypothetical protein